MFVEVRCIIIIATISKLR